MTPTPLLDDFCSRPVYLPDLLEADRARSVDVFSIALTRYLNQHPQESLADIERSLRQNRCWTRLIAAEADPANPCYPPTFRGRICPYELFISTKDPEYAMRELVKRARNEQTNFDRLEMTGLYVVRDAAQANASMEWNKTRYSVNKITDLGREHFNGQVND